MIEATRNQLNVIGNPHQTDTHKVLCVCSIGCLRSPTLANVLHQEFSFNTRSCGVLENWALIPISEALIHWADEIVFVDDEAYDDLEQDTKEEIRFSAATITHLRIPDNYSWNDKELRTECLQQYSEIFNMRNMKF